MDLVRCASHQQPLPWIFSVFSFRTIQKGFADMVSGEQSISTVSQLSGCECTSYDLYKRKHHQLVQSVFIHFVQVRHTSNAFPRWWRASSRQSVQCRQGSTSSSNYQTTYQTAYSSPASGLRMRKLSFKHDAHGDKIASSSHSDLIQVLSSTTLQCSVLLRAVLQGCCSVHLEATS